jgi:hypothetical protein
VQLAVGKKNSLAGSGAKVEAYGLIAAKLRDNSWVNDLMEIVLIAHGWSSFGLL